MNKFEFFNPTKIIFGVGEIAKVAQNIPANSKVLLTYGGGSIKENGVYKQVLKALEGQKVFEFSGIEPNPTYETLMKAVAVVKKENVNFLLAVGGGSVVDGTKFIAAASCYDAGDPWDILSKWAPVTRAIPMGAVLTLPATGSEMNSGAVITKKATHDKLFFGSPLTYPKFSILDPSVTMSLSRRQMGNGVVDAFVHVIEQYLTYPVNAPIQDRFAESLLTTLIEEGKKLFQSPENLEVRSNIMYAATMALNGLIGAGVPSDWSTHMIGHELTALHEIDHARTLAIVLPGNLRLRAQEKQAKLLQYADRVWKISSGNDAEKIEKAISLTEEFFAQMEVPTRLSAYKIGREQIAPIIASLKRHGMVKLGEHQSVTPEVAQKILEMQL